MRQFPSFVLRAALLFLVVAFPAAAAVGIAVGNGTERLPATSSGVVSKTVVSSKTRLVFAVGLEGSGHNYLAGAFLSMFRGHQRVTRLDECRLSWEFYLVRSMTNSPEEYAQALARAREGMRALAVEGENLTSLGGIATLFQLGSPPECKYIGMLSYPNFTGGDKVFRYIDLRMVAELAEAEGVDLRVVYLQRSARDIMIANTIHRDFQK